MRRLGTILHATKNGYIVVRLEDHEKLPPLNIPVYDETMKKIGTLLDIIGPVSEPYAVIKPDSKEILVTVKAGTVVYYEPPRPKRPRRRRGKRAGKPRPVKPRGGGRGKGSKSGGKS